MCTTMVKVKSVVLPFLRAACKGTENEDQCKLSNYLIDPGGMAGFGDWYRDGTVIVNRTK